MTRKKLSNLNLKSPTMPKLNSRCFLNHPLPLLSAPPYTPLCKCVETDTFQVFRKASSTRDNRCGAWGLSVLGRERVNGPCVTVCICYIFYSPLFKLILEAQHLPNLHGVSGFSSSPACLRGSPSPSFDSFS